MTIDGLALPAACALQVGYESVGRTDITADGATAADRLALKRAVRLEWRGLARDEAAQVLTALTRSVFLSVTLPDPLAGEAVTMTARVTALEAALESVDAAGRPGVCQTVTAMLKER